MKRIHAREFALMCAPILLVAGAFLIPLVRHPPKDPNAKIALSLVAKPSNYAVNPLNPRVQFAWEAKATGGPDYGYRIGYQQQIVAIGNKRETVVYSEPLLRPLVGSSSSGGGGGFTSGQGASVSRDVQIDSEGIPATTKRLEWRGEVVALPRSSGSVAVPAKAAQLRKWATFKGAARIVKIFPITFDASKNALRKCALEPVNATNASHGADTCVSVEFRSAARRFYRRLVAFDGRTRRVLWDDNSDGRNPFWQSQGGSGWGGFNHDNILFRVRDVPPAWGEIAFLYDVVFIEGKPDYDAKVADLKTLDALERAGGLRLSRRVVVRAKGQTIKAPAFQATPNLQLQSVKIQKTTTGTQILLAMTYTGKRANPEIDVPGLVEFFDARGQDVEGLSESYRVKRGVQAKQWVLEVSLANPEKAPPKMSMDVEIVDQDAVPLHVRRDIVLPK